MSSAPFSPSARRHCPAASPSRGRWWGLLLLLIGPAGLRAQTAGPLPLLDGVDCECTATGTFASEADGVLNAPRLLKPKAPETVRVSESAALSPGGAYRIDRVTSGSGVSDLVLKENKSGGRTLLSRPIEFGAKWGFSPDGTRFVYWNVFGGLLQVSLYDLTKPTPLSAEYKEFPLHSDAIPDTSTSAVLGFSPSSKQLIVIHRPDAVSVNATLLSNDDDPFTMFGDLTAKWAFSPGGKKLANWWMEFNTYAVKLYDLTTARPAAGSTHRVNVYTDAAGGSLFSGFSPGGDYFLINSRTGAQESTLKVVDMNRVLVSESTTAQTGFGFGDKGYQFAYWTLWNGQETVTRYDLRKASPRLGVTRAGLGGGSSSIQFSPNGHYLLHAALTEPTEVSVQVMDATGAVRYSNILHFYLAPADSAFGAVRWHFGPDEADRSLLLEWTLSQNRTQWLLVNLDRGAAVQTKELVNVSSYTRFSPCGDAVAILQYNAVGYSGWSAHLYSTRVRDKALGQQSYGYSEPVLRTTSVNHEGGPGGNSYQPIALNTAGQACSLAPPPVVKTLTITPAQVMGGTEATGTITLDKAAPTGGAVVSLAASDSAVQVPESVTIPAGSTTKTFTISTSSVRTARTVKVTASLEEVGRDASFVVLPPQLASLTGPDQAPGGESVGLTVTLTAPAPETGLWVHLATDSSVVRLPDSVLVSEDDEDREFSLATSGVDDTTHVTVTASLGAVVKTHRLVLIPATLDVLQVQNLVCPVPGAGRNESIGGGDVHLRIALDGLAGPAGATVALAASSARITVPESAVVPGGASEVIVVATTHAVTTPEALTITATYGAITRAVEMTLVPPPHLYSVHEMGLPPGVSLIERAYVNSRSEVAVTGDFKSFVWRAGVYKPLEVPAGTYGTATSINEQGIVGGYIQTHNSLDRTPGVWIDGQWHPFPKPGSDAAVYGLNNVGVAVGEARDAGGKMRPAMWRDGVFSFAPRPQYYYHLGRADRVNDAGVIAGTAYPDGYVSGHGTLHAYVAAPDSLPRTLAPYFTNTSVQALNGFGEYVLDWGGFTGSGTITRNGEPAVAGAYALNDAGYSVGSVSIPLPHPNGDQTSTSAAAFGDDRGVYALSCLLPEDTPWELAPAAHSLNRTNTIAATGRKDGGPRQPVLLYAQNVPAGSDVALAMEEGPLNVVEGETAAYTFTVESSGPSAATSVELITFLQVPLQVASATSTSGMCAATDSRVVCALGTLQPGTSARVTITAAAVATGTLRTSVALVSRSPDLDAANDFLTLDVTVLPDPEAVATETIAAGDTTVHVAGETGVEMQFTDASDTAGTVTVNRYDGTAPNNTDLLTVSVQTASGPMTPDVVFAGRFWTIEASGLSDFAYQVCLDVTALAPLPSPDALAIVKRPQGNTSWVPLATTTRVADGKTWVCTAGLTSFSQFGLAYADGSLPVELVSFEAVAEGADVRLHWQTASETNNAGFEVEHRAPGAEAFVSRSFVDGHGTTAETQQYTQSMQGLAPGQHTFRLKQVDFDGAVAYSNEVTVEVGLTGAYAFVAPHPNPFTSATAFAVTVARAEQVRVEVYDLTGRRVAVLHEGALTPGQTHRFAFDGAALPSGTYFVRITGETFHEAQAVTLVH